MRIPELNNLMSLARVNRRSDSTDQVEETSASGTDGDKVEISAEGEEFQNKLANALDEAQNSNIREVINSEPPEEIQVDSQRLADRMLEAGVFDDIL